MIITEYSASIFMNVNTMLCLENSTDSEAVITWYYQINGSIFYYITESGAFNMHTIHKLTMIPARSEYTGAKMVCLTIFTTESLNETILVAG